MTWVIDASIAVKWVIPEVLSERADLLRAGGDDLIAPDLLLVEVANALWKKTSRREISPAEADAAFGLLQHSGLDLRPTAPVLTPALQLARRLAHPVYDCVYLALAAQERATLVTADRRLLRLASNRRVPVPVIDLRTI
ncbi:MAG: type II toxin-antitoxin system VapC family toxin [Candidatus Rokubacteria bacterium]|nr:type II toxin-antitoxin system VapC family toxin [Candidatus Rokubacteria bacterium]